MGTSAPPFRPNRIGLAHQRAIARVSVKTTSVTGHRSCARNPATYCGHDHRFFPSRPSWISITNASQFDSTFEQQVYEALTAHGLQVDTQVGVDGYRIDLAIVDPRDPSRYCLAVECDGATYHSGKSVRERDIARQLLLERRGWTFERIWSRDWWRNPQAEIARILRRIPAPTVVGSSPSAAS